MGETMSNEDRAGIVRVTCPYCERGPLPTAPPVMQSVFSVVFSGGNTMSDNEHIGWFEALGSEVTQAQRKQAALEAWDMGVPVDHEDDWLIRIAHAIELNRPDDAIFVARERLDLVGTYRFLGAMCQ